MTEIDATTFDDDDGNNNNNNIIIPFVVRCRYGSLKPITETAQKHQEITSNYKRRNKCKYTIRNHN
jgi:hypothetical protein